MAKLSTLFIVLMIYFLSSISSAQVPNFSFEEWSDTLPDSWSGGTMFIDKSEDARSGSSAVKLQTGMYFGYLVAGVLRSGVDVNGIPVSQRYDNVSCYFKFKPIAASSYFNVTVEFYKGENRIGLGTKTVYGEHNDFTPVSVSVDYLSDEIPERGVIIFSVGEDPATQLPGSYAVIDDVSFSALTDVEENHTVKKFSLGQNFPNPFNPVTKIKYSVPGNAGERTFVTLKVYDILGNVTAVIVNETKTAGEYEAVFNANSLSSGVYIYQLKAGNKLQTKKMTLLK